VLEYFQLADDAKRRSGLELLHTFVRCSTCFPTSSRLSNALPPEPQCDVRVLRRSGFADWLRRYDILVNGKYAGSLAHNATLNLEVPCGKVTLEARIDWGRSRPLVIEAQHGRRIEVEVANHWGAWLALWAITFGSGTYLVLRPKDTA
jgi:hypothetical protein